MNNYDDSDISAKTSGFGIGELSHVPTTTPLDELTAIEINRQTRPAPTTQPHKLIFYSEPKPERTEHKFATLNELLDFTRNAAEIIHNDACLFGPGYTVGDLYRMPGDFMRLTWRIPIKLAKPETYCEECGGDAIDSRGRCTTCGGDDMIVTRWTTWETHQEIL